MEFTETLATHKAPLPLVALHRCPGNWALVQNPCWHYRAGFPNQRPQCSLKELGHCELNTTACSVVDIDRQLLIGRCGEELVNDFIDQFDGPESCRH